MSQQPARIEGDPSLAHLRGKLDGPGYNPAMEAEVPRKSKVPMLLGILALVFLSPFVILGIATLVNPQSVTGLPTSISDGNALSLCQQTLKAEGASHVPSSRNHGRGSEHYFAWGSGEGLRFGNMDGTAHCIVDQSTGRITSLSINGKSLR